MKSHTRITFPASPAMRNFSVFVIACFCINIFTIAFPTTTSAQEVMFEMEESEAPPKGVKQMAEEINKAEEEARQQAAAAAAASAPQTASPGTSTGPGGTGGTGEPAKYHGVFKVFKPLEPVFPLKSANIKASFFNLANNTGTPSSYISRKNLTGGYFIESEENDLWVLKNVAGKFQYNRQLRNTLSVNSMMDWKAELFDTAFKYNRAVRRTGTVDSQNISDARRFLAQYELENGFLLSYNMDQNITRTLSLSPTKTNNRKQTWTLVAPLGFRDGAKFTFIHANTLNRNITGASSVKVLQTDLKFDIPVTNKFDLNLGYQALSNRNLATGTSSENRKKTRMVGLTYNYSDATKISYLYNFSANRNYSTLATSFNTVNRDTQLEHAFSKDIFLKLGYTSTFDQAAGMTTLRTGAFRLDHKDFNFLPGSTSIETRKQYTNTDTSSNTNYTFSVVTPVSYMDGKLTARVQNVLSVQNDLKADQRTRSLNQTFTIQYRLTDSITAGTSLNRVKSGSFTPTSTASRSVSHVRTDQLVYNMGKVLKFIGPLENVRYNFSLSRNSNRAEIPNPALTLNRVKNHSLDFAFKGKDWRGNYNIGRSFALTYGGETQRAINHKVALNLANIWGCQLTTNYTGTFQKNGTQSSAIVKLTKKVSDKTAYFLSYESLLNNLKDEAETDSSNRFLEIGMDLTY